MFVKLELISFDLLAFSFCSYSFELKKKNISKRISRNQDKKHNKKLKI